ncbi:MAG: glycosylhydrolase-like jelly roll fold domain-containing protein, partial [Bacteroidota bacterium]
WGTHFDRTQTWWKPGRALFEYWKRCQALLQWGRIAEKKENDFTVNTEDSLRVKYIHRHQEAINIYFVANTSRKPGLAHCSFSVKGMQPELWDPVTAQIRQLTQFEFKNGVTSFDIQFDKAQSFFIVFRKKSTVQLHARPNFPLLKTITEIDGAWKVQFDSLWGGPPRPLLMKKLQDWTTSEIKGVKYFSGTAVYTNHFRLTAAQHTQIKTNCYLDLGNVKHIASIQLNGKDLGVVWTAPWRIAIPAGWLQLNNYLKIEVTNVWANRLIGDEQEPADCEWLPAHLDNGKFLKEFPDWFLKNEQRPSAGRYCFTTWNYFSKDYKLVSAGLLGPVQLMVEQ